MAQVYQNHHFFETKIGIPTVVWVKAVLRHSEKTRQPKCATSIAERLVDFCLYRGKFSFFSPRRPASISFCKLTAVAETK